MTNTNVAFEAWMRNIGQAHLLKKRAAFDGEQSYLSAGTQHKWQGYQACHAALSSPPPSELVSPTLIKVINDAWESWERYGATCRFENREMIHASVLEEIHDALESSPPPVVQPVAQIVEVEPPIPERFQATWLKGFRPKAGELLYPASQPANAEGAALARMFSAACVSLGLISEALGLDPDDGGAEPILTAIEELKADIAPNTVAVLQKLLTEQKTHYGQVAAAASTGDKLYVGERDCTEGVIKGIEYCIDALRCKHSPVALTDDEIYEIFHESTLHVENKDKYAVEFIRAYEAALLAKQGKPVTAVPMWTAEEFEEVINSLDDDAAALLNENEEDETAHNMRRAGIMIQVLLQRREATTTAEVKTIRTGLLEARNVAAGLIPYRNIKQIDAAYTALTQPLATPQPAPLPVQAVCKACDGRGSIHTGIDEAPTSQCLKCDGSGLAPAAQAVGDATKKKYHELLYAVAKKWPNETRHQTALRYIQQAERSSNTADTQAEQQEPKS